MYLEDLKLLKMDFLGIRNLSIIDECLNLIGKLKFNDIPLDDKKTYELFQRGDTNGIFQFESPGMSSTFRRALFDLNKIKTEKDPQKLRELSKEFYERGSARGL